MEYAPYVCQKCEVLLQKRSQHLLEYNHTSTNLIQDVFFPQILLSLLSAMFLYKVVGMQFYALIMHKAWLLVHCASQQLVDGIECHIYIGEKIPHA